MKLLVITQNYPPNHTGGYELRCKEVIDNLITRGHEVKIITAKNRKLNKKLLDSLVHQKFHTDDGSKNFFNNLIFGYLDVLYLDKIIRLFKPDIIYLWQIAELSRVIFPYLAESKMTIVVDEGGVGIRRSWQSRGVWNKADKSGPLSHFKELIKKLLIGLMNIISRDLFKRDWAWPKIHAYFNSELNHKNTRQLDIPLHREEIIHSGIDLTQFQFNSRNNIKMPLQIITPGRITQPKGIRDGVFLTQELIRENIRVHWRIIGHIGNKAYYDDLMQEVKSFNLEDKIEFIPMVNRSNLASYYQEADICFFPSYNKTGFSRVPLEAMASGSLVISYGNEGSNEVISSGVSGLIVGEGDINSCVKFVKEMICDPIKFQTIVNNAYYMIKNELSMEKYIDNIENFLEESLNGSTLKQQFLNNSPKNN